MKIKEATIIFPDFIKKLKISGKIVDQLPDINPYIHFDANEDGTFIVTYSKNIKSKGE